MKSIILLLGSPNNEKGQLSQIALNRIECAYNLYATNEQMYFLCTGGFEEHFNKTNQPHALYTKQFLIEKGVKEDVFLPFILSLNYPHTIFIPAKSSLSEKELSTLIEHERNAIKRLEQ